MAAFRKASARVLGTVTFLCAASLLYCQHPYVAEQTRKMVTPPPLPVITEPVLPGEGWGPGPYALRKPTTIFDSWKPGRVALVRLPAGTSVTLLSGLSEVHKPGLIKVVSPIPSLSLSIGDTILRYTQRGEGNADFWAKGRWYTNGDLGWVRNADGSGCQNVCKAEEKEPGHSVWWFRVRLPDGRTGWTESLDGPNLY